MKNISRYLAAASQEKNVEYNLIIKQAVIVEKLPKTRSGKIARNTLKAMINNKEFKV